MGNFIKMTDEAIKEMERNLLWFDMEIFLIILLWIVVIGILVTCLITGIWVLTNHYPETDNIILFTKIAKNPCCEIEYYLRYSNNVIYMGCR